MKIEMAVTADTTYPKIVVTDPRLRSGWRYSVTIEDVLPQLADGFHWKDKRTIVGDDSPYMGHGWECVDGEIDGTHSTVPRAVIAGFVAAGLIGGAK